VGTILLGAAVLVACSALVGQWICVLAGRERWEWWAPGAGFAALLAIAGTLITAPGHAKTAALGVAAATLAALVSRRTRAAVVTALPDGLVVGGFTLLASFVPFVVNGRSGILGEGMNNDSGAHLGTVWWLEHERGPVPVGALGGGLANVGYPIGPHGLTGALSLDHISIVHAYDAVLIAVLPLTALVALGAFARAPRVPRWIAAVLVGLCYLGVGYTVQASFKETMEALLVIAVVLGVRSVLADPAPGWRAGLPIGVLLAGSVWVYSYAGLLWTGGAAIAVVLASGRLRAALRPMAGAAAAALVVAVPALPDVVKFADSPFNREVGEGNLAHALNPLEALGVWLTYDFRWTPDPFWPTIVLAAAAGLAAIVAIVRLIRAHELALPAALVPTLGLYAYAADERSIYLSAKALAIAAPVVAVTMAAGLLWPSRPRPRSLLRPAVALLAAVVAATAALSSFWALRDSRVGPSDHASELAALRAKIGKGPILLMTKDDLAQWHFVGLDLWQARGFYAPQYIHARPSKPNMVGAGFDFDSFVPKTLDKFRWAITTRTPYQSRAPRNWKPVAQTKSFVLWRRRGRSPLRYPVDIFWKPELRLDCESTLGRMRLGGAGDGLALVRPRPIVGRGVRWRGQARQAGDTATMTLDVPRGRWELSLQYASMPGLRLAANDLDVHLDPTIDRLAGFYRAGTLTQRRSGPLTIRVTVDRGNAIARLLGAPLRTRGLDSPSHRPLGAVALTRVGENARTVQPREACGKWVDYVQPPRR
jgi:hypothetical protein